MNTPEQYLLKMRPYCEERGCMKESVRVLNLDDTAKTKAVCEDHVCSSDSEEARPSNETDNNLPVPVLADSCRGGENPQDDKIETSDSEARESTKVPPVGVSGQDSRGGQNSLSFTESAADWYDHTLFSKEADALFQHQPIHEDSLMQ